jgi:hypothetical protein
MSSIQFFLSSAIPRMKRLANSLAMKIALTTLSWTTSLLFGFVAVVLMCWWLIPDEVLNPEAEAFSTVALAPPATDNAYFMIYGLGSSPELDPHAVGQKIVAAHDRLIAAEKSQDKYRPELFYGDNPLTFPKDSKRLCDPETENCLKLYQARRTEVEALTAEKRIYLDRYRKIREYDDFGAATAQQSLTAPIVAWWPILRMSDLVDGSIAMRMADKDTQEVALSELAAEVTSWKRLLQSNDIVITQMISVNTLHRKYLLACEIMNAYPEAVSTYPKLVEDITKPLLYTEANLATSMRIEALGTFTLLRDFGPNQFRLFFRDLPSLPIHAVFQLGGFRANASINRAYALFESSREHLTKSPKELLEGWERMTVRESELNALSLDAIFFNPIGRVFLSNNVATSRSPLRVGDLIGMTRLLDLQRRIIEGNVAREDVGAMISHADRGLMDPYTEAPMQWDATKRKISFVMQGKWFETFGNVTIDHYR